MARLLATRCPRWSTFGIEVQPHEAETYHALRRQFCDIGLVYLLLYSLFKRISVKYVSAYVYVNNTPSIGILYALGLKREATLKEHIYHSGGARHHDIYFYRT